MKVKVKIKGKTPLLMNKFVDSALEANKKIDKNALPRDMAEEIAYRNKDGELIIPGVCVFAAIIDAGRFHKKGKNKVTTIKSSLIPAGISLEEEDCLLGTKKFEVDSRSVVIPATGGRVMKHRPRLDEWETSFTLDIDKNEFSETEARAFVQDAGSKCGLLEYRPNKKGWFGKFDIVLWKVIEK
jgi:hypothetical protein